ncbi:MAG: hypothetical protein COB85_02440 [Bacteroidetes bacterium]|nr:MAG: hypothetical protein COB85_02440 [Bacteroidota bacterium]
MKNNFLHFYIILAFLVTSNVQAQNMFQNVLGGTGNDYGYFSELTPDSGQITFGCSDGFGFGSNDFFLVKTDINGDTMWAKAYGGVGSDIGRHMQQTSDGGYILAGETGSFGAGGTDIYLVKTDMNGDTMWTKAYGGTGNDFAWYVSETSDSGYIVSGYTGSFGAGGDDAYLLRLNSMGDTLWTRTYGSTGDEYGNSVRETMDSGFVITGEAYAFGAGNGDTYLIRTDAMGDTLWTKVYGGTGFEGGWAVKETMDSGFVISGWTSSFGAGGYDVYLIRTDAMGDTLWTKAYGGGTDDIGLAIVETPDSGYLVSGYTYSFGTINGDAYALSLNSTGGIIWSRAYGGVLGDAGYAINATPDNGYTITGHSNSFSAGDARLFIVKTDSLGNSGSCYETVTATSVTGTPSSVSSTATIVGIGVTVSAAATVQTNCAASSRPVFSVALVGSSNLSCNGDSSGSATVLVTGGTLAYTYAWDDVNTQNTAAANTLYADTFQMIITDGFGCMDSISVTLTEPAAFLPIITVTDVQCNGDSDGVVSVAVSGGIGTLTYLWDDPANQATASATGLSGGTYMVMITDSAGCMDSASGTVVEPGALALSIANNIPVTCNADSSASAASVIVGGTPPFSYLWDDALAQTDSIAVNLASGSYMVIVTDSNGCTYSASTSIGFYAATTGVTPICGGICDGSASATTTGGASPMTYTWDDPLNQTNATASSLCGGNTFSVTVSESGGCTSVSSVSLTGSTVMNVSLSIKDIICFNDSNGEMTALVSGGNPPYTYLWPTSGTTILQITDQGPGTYSLIVTDNTGCSKTISGTIVEPTALTVSSTVVQPSCNNSGDGEVSLTVNGGTSPYLYTWDNPNSSTTKDVTDLFSGDYVVNIVDTNNCPLDDTITVGAPNSLALTGNYLADTGSSSGSASVFVAGGTSPYSYSWSPTGSTNDTLFALAMGAYSVTVTDANGCIEMLTVNVSDGDNPIFQTTYEGAMDDFGRSLDEVTGGGYIVTGFTSSFGAGGTDVYLVRTDANGNHMWSKTYGGAADDQGNAVIQTSDGGFIIAGFTMSFGAGESDVYVIKTNASGDITWTMAYGGASDDRGFSISELSGGGYIIAGGTNSYGVGNTDVYVIEIDANGAVQWTKTYGGAGFDYGYSVQQTTNNGFIIAGYTYSFGAGDANAYLIKIDNVGNSEWASFFGGNDDDELRSVEQTTDGGYIVAGYSKSFGNGKEDVFVVKVDQTGAETWSRTFGGDKVDIGNSVTESTAGGYIVAGSSFSFGSPSEKVYLVKIDANGGEEWSKTYGGAYHDRGWAVIQTADQGYAVVGNATSFAESVTAGPWEFYLLKTDHLGSTNCNVFSVNSTVLDTSDTYNPITITPASGGAGVPAATVESVNTTLAGSLCFKTTGIESDYTTITKEGDLIVYPNPNSGTFNVSLTMELKDKDATLRVFDIKGMVVYSETDLGTGNIAKQIVLDHADKGMYFVQLISKDGSITKKIICQ